MKRSLGLIALLVVAVGCGNNASEPEGYKQTDFQSKPKPEGYGPPGGTPAKPPTGG